MSTSPALPVRLASLAKFWVTTAVLIALAALALQAGKPTSALGNDAAANAFSAARAMPHLRQIAKEPHPIGSPANAAVRSYLLAELAALGFKPEVQSTLGVFNQRGLAIVGQVHNVLMRKDGVASDHAQRKAVLLSAHYDSVPTGPGAGDDGASVAAILETLRALGQGPALQNDLIVLFSDGEEVALLGAEAFVAEHPWAKDVGMALNFEYRGNRGPMIMFETSVGNGRLIEGYARATPHPIGNSLNYEIYKLLPNDTDFSVLKRGAIRGLNFAAIDGHTSYHTALDSPELLDQNTLQHQGDTMLALTRYFGNLNLDDLPAPDHIYFDAPGLGVLHYPASAALPLALFCAIVFAGVWFLGVRRGRLRTRGLLIALPATLVMLALLAGAAQALWLGVLAVHPSYRLILHGTTYNSHWYLLAFCALACGGYAALQQLLRRFVSATDLAMGSMLVWLILLVGVSWFMPGASFLLCWPLLAMALALGCVFALPPAAPAAQSASQPGRRDAIILLVGAAPAVLLLAPLIRAIFIGLGPNLMWGMVLTFALLLGLLAALWDGLTRPLAWTATSLGIGFLLMGALTAGFDAAHPRPSNLSYLKDGQTGKAWWLSTDQQLDAWTRPYFPGIAAAVPIPSLSGANGPALWSSPAPDIGLSLPRILVQEDRVDGAKRIVRVEISSARNAPDILISVEGTPVLKSAFGRHEGATEFAPTTRSPWTLRAFAMEQQPIPLTLTVAANTPFLIRVRERSLGLPNVGLPEKPAAIMVQPFTGSSTSQTLQVLHFP